MVKIQEAKEDIVPVCVFLKDCDKSAVFTNLERKYKYNVEAYENEQLYYTEVVPNLTVDGKTIEQLLNYEESQSYNLDLDNKNSTIDLRIRRAMNKAIVDNVNEYLVRYRKEVLGLVQGYVSNFVNTYYELFDDVIFKSNYSELVIANVSPENVRKLSKLSIIERVDYFNNIEFENFSWNASEVTSSDSITGLGSDLYNYGSGYDGTGIKIGIIEPEYLRYDTSNYNLQDANISYVNTPGVTNYIVLHLHPTKVSALICGKRVTIDGKTYGGVASGATVYQTGIGDLADLLNAIENFSSMGVNVINFSGGEKNGTSYDFSAQCVDDILFNTRMSFVVAVGNKEGNNLYAATPGKAYNAITVGNLATKSGNETWDKRKVYPASSYIEDSWCANKPDVVAPGTDIYWPVSEDEVSILGRATSFSAPIVTAIVAQLMQDDVLSMLNPNAAKNYVICGASNEGITGTNISYGALTDESGAGLINAVNSFDIASSDRRNYYYGMYLASDTAPTEYTTIAELDLSKGDSLRVALTFQKEENIPLTSEYGNNIDIRLVRDNQYSTYCVKSESTNNNVELIDTKISSTGKYWLQVRLTSSILDSDNNDLHYWVSWRKY